MNGRVLSEEEIVGDEQTIIASKYCEYGGGSDERIMDYIATIRHLQRKNKLMRDFLETLKERAQNDINIRTKQGQHVGSVTFASLQGAREVMAVCRALAKVNGVSE